MFHERNKDLLPFARRLRKEMTKEEKRLWYQFLRAYPVRFRRQEIIGDYIADFYCAAAKLVIELDGSQHYEQEALEKDRQRTHRLNEMGLTVLRIPNLELSSHFEGVCEYIDAAVKEALSEKPLSR